MPRHHSRPSSIASQITERIVQTMRNRHGRGPLGARTQIVDDLVICRLADVLIPVERTLLERGAYDEAVELRRVFQRMMKPEWAAIVQELTRRSVVAVLADVEFAPTVAVIVFVLGASLVLDGPGGAGADAGVCEPGSGRVRSQSAAL